MQQKKKYIQGKAGWNKQKAMQVKQVPDKFLKEFIIPASPALFSFEKH